MKLSVIIPVYNEEKTVNALLDKVQASPVEKQIVIVDDGSTDGTRALLQSRFPNGTPAVKVVLSEGNQGKGAAIRAGLAHADGDLVLIQDADLEYDPANYPELIKPFADPAVQAVYGSRFLRTTTPEFLREWFRGKFLKKGERRYLSTYLGIRFLNFLCYVLYDLKTTDEATCYKVFRTSLLKGLGLECQGFNFCPEVTAKIGRKGISPVEVPIVYHPRTFHEGKKLNVWRDGAGAIWTLVKYRFC